LFFVLHNTGLSSWSTNSRIVRAESTTGPGGEYTFQTVVKARFAHEPTIVGPTPEGEWLLFHVGAGKGTWTQNTYQPCTTCVNGSTPAACKDLTYPHGSADFIAPTVLWKAAAPRGPWSEVGVIQTPDKDHDGYSDANPSAVILPNSSVLMMWRGAGCACSNSCPALKTPLPNECSTNLNSCWQSRLHLATAPHYSNFTDYDFNKQTLFPCSVPNVAERGAEDPYLWFETGSGYHAVLHRNGCKKGVGCDPKVSGQHAYSEDGKSWHLSAVDAYNATVYYTDGTTEELQSRERPHLILDPASGKPTHLVTGANCNRPDSPGRTITHIQPINV
jgi:hypothetical protein